MNYFKITIIWIAGLFIALAIFCGICFAFHNSMEPNIYAPEVDRMVPMPDLTHRHRSEGWGKTLYGKYGIYGIPDILKHKENKVLLWGDSYVEALEVDDKDKTTFQFNALWKKNHKTPLICAGVGSAGTNLADYVHYAPIYEKLIPDVKAHVVFLHSDMVRFKEIRSKVGGALEFESDLPRFVFRAPNRETSALKEKGISILRFFGLDFVWWVYTDLRNYKWRFSLGQHGAKDDIVFRHFKQPVKIPEQQWNYAAYELLIKQFRKATDKDIVFIYAAHVPYIYKEKIYLQDRSSDFICRISELCRKNHVTFINMEDSFREYYKKTKKSPRGFSNSRPFLGHLNSEGHKLVAEKLVEYFEKDEKDQ